MQTLRAAASIIASAAEPGPGLVEVAPVARSEEQVEVVVTANRRAERLQDVPLSVSVVGAEELTQQRIESVRQLNALAPNLSVQPGIVNGGSAVISIRGLASTGDESLGFESPIGLYIDGVPIQRGAAATVDLLDLDRVEVLRGPQGTLFGRNTTGGAINFISADPRERSRARIELEAGTRSHLRSSVSLETGRIGRHLRLGLSGRWQRRHGVVDNLAEPRDARDPGATEQAGFRASALLDELSGWTIRLAADWSRIDATPWTSQAVAVGSGAQIAPLTIDGAVVPVVQPAPVGPWLQNSVPALAGCSPTVNRARQSSLCIADTARARDRFWGGMLRIERSLGPALLRSTTALRQWRNRNGLVDIDGLPRMIGPAFTSATVLAGISQSLLETVPGISPELAASLAATAVPLTSSSVLAASNDRGTRQWSHEIDLRSDDGGTFDWVVGAFAFSERGWERNRQNIGAVIDIARSVLEPTFGPLAPALIAALPAGTRYRLANRDVTLAYEVSNRSLALYGQVSGQFAENSPLGYAAGLRLTHDSREIRRTQNGPTPFTLAEVRANDGRVSFTDVSGHLTLTAKPYRQLTAWLRLADGYQAGGWNARQPTRLSSGSASAIELTPYNPERLTSLELGSRYSKGSLLLAATLYAQRYSNRLVSVPIPDAPSFGTLVVNGARSRAFGMEVEGRLQITSWLAAIGAAGFNRSTITRFPALASDGSAVDIASVVREANSPKYTANLSLLGSWATPFGAMIDARLGWTGVGKRSFFNDPTRAPLSPVLTARASNRFDVSVALRQLQLARASIETQAWVSGLGRPRGVRGVDLGQLGVATMILDEPWRAGLTLRTYFE